MVIDIDEFGSQLYSQDGFVEFLQYLQEFMHENPDRGGNKSIPDFFDAMTNRLSDVSNDSIFPEGLEPSWPLFAKLLMVGAIYD
jgi:hypothetical protein